MLVRVDWWWFWCFCFVMWQVAQKTAATFAPRASTATKNPAVPGTVLYSVFEVQGYVSMLLGGALSFNLIFPSDEPDIWRLMGMWSIWMFSKFFTCQFRSGFIVVWNNKCLLAFCFMLCHLPFFRKFEWSLIGFMRFFQNLLKMMYFFIINALYLKLKPNVIILSSSFILIVVGFGHKVSNLFHTIVVGFDHFRGESNRSC